MTTDAQAHEAPTAKRSNSRARPATPLRPSSRSSFRDSSARHASDGAAAFLLNVFEPALAELSDAMADFEANMSHFQLMHESLARFSEAFASFLYGLNMNAFCVDFPEAPIPESFNRYRRHTEGHVENAVRTDHDTEATFMTTDISFVENPSLSTKSNSTHVMPETRQSRLPHARGSSRSRSHLRGRGRPSGLARLRSHASR